MIGDSQISKSTIVLSVLVAFYVDIKAVNWALVHGGFIGDGAMKLLYPLVVGLIFLCSFLMGERKHFSRQVVFLFLYLMFYYFFTYSFIGPPDVDVNTFLAMVLVAMIIPAVATIDAKWFLRALVIIPSFAILRLNEVFAPEEEWYISVSLDCSYGYLIPVMGAQIYYFSFFKQERKQIKLVMSFFCLINAVFFIQLLIRGSRGTLLCFFSLFVFLFIIKKRKVGLGAYVNKKKLRIIVYSLIAIILFTSVFYLFLDKIQSMIGVDIYAIQHMLETSSKGDVLNGRSYLNRLTWNGIMDSPIWGNGIDRFNANTKGSLYPHNFILQVLYDGGLVLLLLLLIPVISGTIKCYRRCSYDEYVIFTFLFFCSVPGALFSISIYNNAALWVFFGAVMVHKFVLNRS